MALTIKTDKTKWKKIVEEAADYMAGIVAETMLADSTDYVPNDGEGYLADSGSVQKTDVKGERNLVWGESGGLVYTSYQWFGMRNDETHVVKHYTKPGTGKAWVDQAASARKDDWDKTAQNAFTEGMEKAQ